MADNISQHKRMAMGQQVTGMKKGGPVVKPAPMTAPIPKTGMRNSPIENVKRVNGVPGMKKGGKC